MIGKFDVSSMITDNELLIEPKSFLIPKEKLNLSTVLGQGQFGKVYKGHLLFNDKSTVAVAAKTLKGLPSLPSSYIV